MVSREPALRSLGRRPRSRKHQSARSGQRPVRTWYSQDGYDMGDRPHRGRWRDLESGEHGGGGTRRRDPHHRHADEFDDTQLAAPFGIEVLWNAVDDDFQPKSPEVFRRGVEFALAVLDEPGTKLYVHCAAGVHRAPM